MSQATQVEKPAPYTNSTSTKGWVQYFDECGQEWRRSSIGLSQYVFYAKRSSLNGDYFSQQGVVRMRVEPPRPDSIYGIMTIHDAWTDKLLAEADREAYEMSRAPR